MIVAVVGAGPAGMAAAAAAADAGADAVLVDGEPAPGGQYHRGHPPRLDPRVRHLADSTVWAVEGRRLHLLTGPADAPRRTAAALDADAVVLATGAHDRVLPFPGWDLPGVYTAGAAQALAKGQRVAVGRRVVVAGTGPFLLPVAGALLAAGAGVTAVCEAAGGGRWLRHPAAIDAGRLAELARYAAVLRRHRVPWRRRTAVVAAHGDGRVTAVTLARLNPDWTVRATRRVPADAVCVGHGFTPRLELAVAAGCALAGGFVRVDERGATSAPGYWAAGEVTGIGGADAAAAEGAVAGAAAAGATPPAAALARARRGRRFAAALADAHPIRDGWRSWLDPDTLVCRCEEVTLGALRAAVAHGAGSVRTVKLASRAGLGMCQGRVCGPHVADLVAADPGGPPADPAAWHRRPVATPVRLGELAGPHPPEEIT
ncbi:pyridine nucleotide-disulfide oxidoreductase [Pilimelia anulata]|uniref:Pyridine nucleotide-disulfide oxidoreductase n=1 Tax=Pilimelia anulata TaxID=53371 RepID=A0A8J3F680_9ACTN|nr:NAD(P)/FAD-dependent oxidoreductase [Pilimelia anulata]GGJ78397.1 pyridine nucleotide-disulfide oxidoreductase [Pilimelia anulata]